MDPRAHWEKIYETRKPTEVSWYQPTATVSLGLIRRAAPDPTAPIIDVGGGTSTLVDDLLADGYSNLTVIDLSASALDQARMRLGEQAVRVRWLAADILQVRLRQAEFAVWHDRAVFHFLTVSQDRIRYVEQVRHAVRLGGHVLVATFATDGPTRCSGLEVVRYSPEDLHAQFGPDFQLLESVREMHHTPSGAEQAFVYCMCRVRQESGPVRS